MFLQYIGYMINEQVNAAVETVTLKSIGNGGYFKRIRNGQPTEAIYVRGEYNRSTKRYQVNNVDDVWGSGIELKATTKVFVTFEY